MKKLLFSAISALAVAGVASAADSTQFGVLPVFSSAKRTLVAIPWVESSTAGSDIAVSNLVLTANLTAGDTLDVLDDKGSSLNRWLLTDNGGGILYWNSVKMVGDGYEAQSPAANAATIKRGSAVVLMRQNPKDGNNNAKPFYLMGQVAFSGPTATIGQGSEATPWWSMVAPPSTVAQKLNGDAQNGGTWTNVGEKDRIYLSLANGWTPELKWDGGKWKIQKTVVTSGVATLDWVEYTDAIPVGTGFWYVSKGGSPTVTWTDVPTAN